MNSLQHLACLMDGNRRWAKAQGMPALYGYKKGVDAAQRVVMFCLRNKIPYLSLFALSLENVERSGATVFSLILDRYEQSLQDFLKHGIRVRFIGDLSYAPENVVRVCHYLEQETAHLTSLHLNFLLCYGARQEIAYTVAQIVKHVQNGTLDPVDITEKTVAQYSWFGDIPDPDLIIRTGKVVRMSNFMLMQAAYAELRFPDIFWPDITEECLEKIVAEFMHCERRFGIV